jgi:hypothetical protein
MITIDKPSIYLMWGDELVQVVGISEGKVIHMQTTHKCEKCGTPYTHEYSFTEDSPYFQEMARPVKTIKETQS